LLTAPAAFFGSLSAHVVQGASVDGVLMHLTVFEIPDGPSKPGAKQAAAKQAAAAGQEGAASAQGPAEGQAAFQASGDAPGDEGSDARTGGDDDDPVPPTLRFVGYNPRSGHRSLLIVPPQVTAPQSQPFIKMSAPLSLNPPTLRTSSSNLSLGLLHSQPSFNAHQFPHAIYRNIFWLLI
jgi:hypothetical protein